MSARIFIDSDIILDVLAERIPFYEPAAVVFDLAYEKKIELCTTAVVLANVFYFLRKKLGIEKSKQQLKKLRSVMHVLSVDENMVDNVLNSKFGDFEDGLQYFSAKKNRVSIILTRNTRDYKEKDIVIQTAAEYIQMSISSGN